METSSEAGAEAGAEAKSFVPEESDEFMQSLNLVFGPTSAILLNSVDTRFLTNVKNSGEHGQPKASPALAKDVKAMLISYFKDEDSSVFYDPHTTKIIAAARGGDAKSKKKDQGAFKSFLESSLLAGSRFFEFKTFADIHQKGSELKMDTRGHNLMDINRMTMFIDSADNSERTKAIPIHFHPGDSVSVATGTSIGIPESFLNETLILEAPQHQFSLDYLSRLKDSVLMNVKEAGCTHYYGTSSEITHAYIQSRKETYSLAAWLTDKRNIINPDQMALILYQIVVNVAIIHSLLINHLDIKPSNITLTPTPVRYGDKVITDFPIVKMIDFGSSQGGYEQPLARLPFTGTWEYAPPEILYGSSYITNKTDVWSLVCTMCTLATEGSTPFMVRTYKETRLFSQSERQMAVRVFMSMFYDDNIPEDKVWFPASKEDTFERNADFFKKIYGADNREAMIARFREHMGTLERYFARYPGLFELIKRVISPSLAPWPQTRPTAFELVLDKYFTEKNVYIIRYYREIVKQNPEIFRIHQQFDFEKESPIYSPPFLFSYNSHKMYLNEASVFGLLKSMILPSLEQQPMAASSAVARQPWFLYHFRLAGYVLFLIASFFANKNDTVLFLALEFVYRYLLTCDGMNYIDLSILISAAASLAGTCMTRRNIDLGATFYNDHILFLIHLFLYVHHSADALQIQVFLSEGMQIITPPRLLIKQVEILGVCFGKAKPAIPFQLYLMMHTRKAMETVYLRSAIMRLRHDDIATSISDEKHSAFIQRLVFFLVAINNYPYENNVLANIDSMRDFMDALYFISVIQNISIATEKNAVRKHIVNIAKIIHEKERPDKGDQNELIVVFSSFLKKDHQIFVSRLLGFAKNITTEEMRRAAKREEREEREGRGAGGGGIEEEGESMLKGKEKKKQKHMTGCRHRHMTS